MLLVGVCRVCFIFIVFSIISGVLCLILVLVVISVVMIFLGIGVSRLLVLVMVWFDLFIGLCRVKWCWLLVLNRYSWLLLCSSCSDSWWLFSCIVSFCLLVVLIICMGVVLLYCIC